MGQKVKNTPLGQSKPRIRKRNHYPKRWKQTFPPDSQLKTWNYQKSDGMADIEPRVTSRFATLTSQSYLVLPRSTQKIFKTIWKLICELKKLSGALGRVWVKWSGQRGLGQKIWKLKRVPSEWSSKIYRYSKI